MIRPSVQAAPGRPLFSELGAWWPFLLVGPMVMALRVSAPVSAVASWAWLPVTLVVAAQLLRHRRRLLVTGSTALLIGFVIWAGLSLAWTPAFGRGLRLVGLVVAFLIAYMWGAVAGPPSGSSRLWGGGAAGLGIALLALVLFPHPPTVEGLNPDRILAMGVIALVVASWYGPRTRWQVALVGLAGLSIVVASGSRMASFVLLGLLVTAPGLRLPRTGRLLLGVLLTTLVALAATTTGFQERWFQDDPATLSGLFTLDNLQTSGRFEVWPEVASQCDRPVTGLGAGTADSLSVAESEGFPEPHNEYLRAWCDTGLIGSVLFWGFVAFILIHAMRARPRPARGHRSAVDSAVQLGIALLLLSLTDNPLTTTLPFLIPLGLVFGWVEGSQESIVPSSRAIAGRGARRRLDS